MVFLQHIFTCFGGQAGYCGHWDPVTPLVTDLKLHLCVQDNPWILSPLPSLELEMIPFISLGGLIYAVSNKASATFPAQEKVSGLVEKQPSAPFLIYTHHRKQASFYRRELQHSKSAKCILHLTIGHL